MNNWKIDLPTLLTFTVKSPTRFMVMAANVEPVQRLITSCDEGDIETVQSLLNHQEKKSFINERDEDNETLLFKAAKRGHYEIAQLLLKHEADVDSLNGKDDCTPLIIASEHGYTKTVELLLQYKANANAQTIRRVVKKDKESDVEFRWRTLRHEIKYGPEMGMEVHRHHLYGRYDDSYREWTALMIASKNGHFVTINILLEHGANVSMLDEYNRSALMIASANGHTKIVTALIKQGANVNIQDHNGWSALMLASANDHIQVVKLLLEQRANVNMTTFVSLWILKSQRRERINSGVSALMIASQKGYVEVAKILLKHGAKVNKLDNNQESALMFASKNGSLEIAELILKHRPKINAQNDKGMSALMIASEMGHTRIVDLLLNCGADPNIRDSAGMSALMIASKQGYTTTAELLLEHKANIKKDGQSSFMLAIKNEQVQTAYFLLKHGVVLRIEEMEEKLSLIIASEHGHNELVEFLLLHGGDVNAQIVRKRVSSLSDKTEQSLTALMAASENGHSKTAKLLLVKYGADVNLRNDKGRSALMFASVNGHIKTAKLLLEHGANINFQGNDGFSAFMLACKNFHVEMAKLLLEYGVDKYNIIQKEEKTIKSILFRGCEEGHIEIVKFLLQLGGNSYINVRTGDGWSALMIASKHMHYTIVKLLLEYGASVNLQNYSGESALMITHHTKIASLLLEYGASVSLKNNRGLSALRIGFRNQCLDIKLLRECVADRNKFKDDLIHASRANEIELVKFLLNFGTNVNAQGADGWSALHYACWNGDDEMGCLLLDYGADVNIKKKFGVSALMIASRRGHNNMVELLLEHGADVDLRDNDGRTALTIAYENGHPETAKLLQKSGTNVSCWASLLSLENQGELAHDDIAMDISSARTIVQVTNSEQLFLWHGFGLHLHIPENCLPAEVLQCTIELTASLMGDYQLPEATYLVSVVYSIKCLPKCRFSKLLTLEIQHCAKQKNVHKLCFIRSRANSGFQIIGSDKTSQAFFAEHSSYGFIELDRFCRVAVGQRGSDERDYRASVYRQRHGEESDVRHQRIHFVILWDTDAHYKIACEHYQRFNMELDVDHLVEFEESQIKLDIPYPKGITTENKEWRIIPLTPPVISKKDVDKFVEGRWIPHCQLEAKCAKDEPGDLEHSVKLNGAKEPYNAFTISIPACKTRYPSHDVRSAQPGNRRGNRELTYAVLLRELSEAVSADWEDIGRLLKLSQGSLEVIKSDCPSHAKKCFREMIQLWFKQVDPPPSWAAIIKAIDVLGHETLAKDLSKEFL